MENNILKKIKNYTHEKEFDTQTLITNISGEIPDGKNTKEALTLKELAQTQSKDAEGKETTVYQPKPLTPDDDIYEEIIEQFAAAPTKPKYWFEEFGDYWSCSCGHINRGTYCKSCGLDRELLRSLFILHKPVDKPGELNKKLRSAKIKVDEEEQHHQDKDARRKQREAVSGDCLEVVPIETDSSNKGSEHDEITENPIELKVDVLPVKNENLPAVPKKKSKHTAAIVVAILLCIALIAGASYAIYVHFAAPAMQYNDAKDLQANGKYEEAIEKYQALGDYEDCTSLIWECYILMADEYYADGKFDKAIETYNIAAEIKNNDDIQDKIRDCHIGKGDAFCKEKQYTKALSSYSTAADMNMTSDLQDKINAAKFGYVKIKIKDDDDTAIKYMHELMDINYPGIQKIYDEYYSWHVKIVANTSEQDFSTDVETVSRKDTVYFHVSLSGGEPDETLQLYYEVTWPDGQSQISDLGPGWKDGSNITARFQYPMPLFGTEGKLTFKLFDKNTQEILRVDTVTFKK